MKVGNEMIERCRTKLEEVAARGERITYGELMRDLQIPRDLIGDCLNPIYEAAVHADPPKADVTLIVHYDGSPFGRYNSQGAKAQSIEVDTSNDDAVAAYKAGLLRVYVERGVSPSRNWKSWLEA